MCTAKPGVGIFRCAFEFGRTEREIRTNLASRENKIGWGTFRVAFAVKI